MKKNKWKKGLVLFLAVAAVFSKSMIPVQASEYWPPEPQTASPCVMVMEMNTGAVLYEKNADEVHYPASITKIMTTLLAIEQGNLDDTVTFSADAVYKNEGDSSHISRDLNEKMTLEECLYGVMLESANECAYAVAEHIGGGSVSKFVDMMNKRAKELGCTNTHFNNTNGLPDEKHYTTTRDMVLISRAAYQNETFRKITGTGRYVIPPTNKHEEETVLQNHHSMLYPLRTGKYLYEGCTGGKTGYTTVANSTLVTYGERDGMALVCVVMNTQAPNHFTDTMQLFDYYFNNFQIFSVKDHEKAYTKDRIQDTGILDTNQSFVGLDKNGGIILPKTASFEDAKVEVKEKGEGRNTAGRLEYTYAGHEVGGADIIVTEAKPDEFPFDNTTDASKKDGKKIFIKGNTLVTLLVVAGICGILVLLGRYISDHYYLMKSRFDRKREKPDPRYTIIRNHRKKWWNRRK